MREISTPHQSREPRAAPPSALAPFHPDLPNHSPNPRNTTPSIWTTRLSRSCPTSGGSTSTPTYSARHRHRWLWPPPRAPRSSYGPPPWPRWHWRFSVLSHRRRAAGCSRRRFCFWACPQCRLATRPLGCTSRSAGWPKQPKPAGARWRGWGAQGEEQGGGLAGGTWCRLGACVIVQHW